MTHATMKRNKPATSRKPLSQMKKDAERHAWFFLVPFLALFALVLIVPILYSLYISMFETTLVRGTNFIGFQNYLRLLDDTKFWEAAIRVVLFTAIQVPIMLAAAVGIALALDSRRLHGMGFLRMFVFLPYAIPAIVSTLMWGFMMGVRWGLLREFNDLTGMNLDLFRPPFTMIAIGLIIMWGMTGYNVLIFYSSLKAVPGELYEAAELDGANQWKVVRYVKLPALRGTLAITLIFSIIGTFQLFNEPLILPDVVSNSGITNNFTPNIYVYQLAFTGSQQGYAAAVALVMALITIVFAYTVQLTSMRSLLRRR